MSSTTPHSAIRHYRALASEGFVFKNTTLLKSIKVKRAKNLHGLTFRINSVELQPSSTTKDCYIFDFAAIRESIRDLLGFTPEENLLIRLEATLSYNGLNAFQHYKQVAQSDEKVFRNTIFTSELQIAFKPYQTKTIQGLDVEEEYYKSDAILESE